MTNYSDFRKIMKHRAEEIVKRFPNKYKDMELTSVLA